MTDGTVPSVDEVKHRMMRAFEEAAASIDKTEAEEKLPPGAKLPTIGISDPAFLSRMGHQQGTDRQPLERRVRDALMELMVDGIVIPAPCVNPSNGAVLLTSQGRRAIAEGRFGSVEWINPTEYVNSVEDAAGGPLDSIVKAYLMEAKLASDRCMELSCAVCIGCASERAITLLAETFEDTAGHSDLKTDLDADYCAVGHIFGHLSTALYEYRKNNGLRQAPHWQDLPVVDCLFHLYRMYRNQAGHAVATTQDRDALIGFLQGFKTYARIIAGLTKYLRQAHP